MAEPPGRRGGYHGDTFWAMAVCDPDGGMHRIWDGVLPRQVFADTPPAGFAAGVDTHYAERLRALVAAHAGDLAAVIVEPGRPGTPMAGSRRWRSSARVCSRRCRPADKLCTGVLSLRSRQARQ
jgi:adenosylmethionine---8-amino-7-oxononanoate aminotransferase